MAKYLKKTKTEIVMQSIKRFARKYVPYFNQYENENLSENFKETVIAIKEKNSKRVFETYYIPKAITEILRESNLLATDSEVQQRATAMMFSDMANGILTEFYRFK